MVRPRPASSPTKFGSRLPDDSSGLHSDDILIRVVPQNRRNRSGRPARGAFRGPIVETVDGAVYETSVYCKRLLEGRSVPIAGPKDLLAEFPLAWVLDIKITKSPLYIVPDPTDSAHFLIRGRVFHPEFLDFLRDKSVKYIATPQ